jgi:hypothetical protein
VLVVPNDIDVPDSPRCRHVNSLVDLTPRDLRTIHAQLTAHLDDGVLPRG